MSEFWIPVTENSPKLHEIVLIYDSKYDQVRMASREDRRYWLGGRKFGKVTHWMPLPGAPKKGES